MSTMSPKRPVSLSGLSSLFSDPKTFFSGTYNLKHVGSLLVIYLIWANSGSSDSIVFGEFDDGLLSGNLNSDVLESYLSSPKTKWNLSLSELLINSVTSVFFFLFTFFGFFIKACYCGYRPTANIGMLAVVYLYTEAIVHIPLFVHRVLQVILYSGPMAATLDTNQTLFLVCRSALNILGVIVGYQAVQSVFGLTGKRTRLWFRDIPILFCGCGLLISLL